MNVLYKPKYVINFNDYNFIENTYKIFSVVEQERISSLFQIETTKIFLPDEHGRFNITDIFNICIDHIDNDVLKINSRFKDFNIIFYVDKKYAAIWPRKFEKELTINDSNGINVDSLTYNEFIIKKLLE